MSFFEREDVRRHWKLIVLLLLALIYFVYLLLNQLHPPLPCPSCSACDPSTSFLDPIGDCISAADTIGATCPPVQTTTQPSLAGIICYDTTNPTSVSCFYTSPFTSPQPNTFTLFFDNTFYEVTIGEVTSTNPKCNTPNTVCHGYVASIPCQDA